ncbi:hypothetical protein HK097_005094 [Rhizophlyctis rosea]|uniref:Uncharacterized protein n=1 Tax=Rhizophlyctis rosea TaxID=64517 RepID=A0AAD5X8Y7_9FUNG|nr:hypothetical protein HK097_005094 [Rhizophlyctis rosea]
MACMTWDETVKIPWGLTQVILLLSKMDDPNTFYNYINLVWAFHQKVHAPVKDVLPTDPATAEASSLLKTKAYRFSANPRLQKNLRKGLELLDRLTREVLQEVKQKKAKEMSELYVQSHPRSFDKAFRAQHGAEANHKYILVLIDKLEHYKQAATKATSSSVRSQKRQLWQATKLASQLHRSALFGVMLEFSKSKAGGGETEWVYKVEKHLRKAGAFQLAIDTIISWCRHPFTSPFFRNLRSPPHIVDASCIEVLLDDWRTVLETHYPDDVEGFAQRLDETNASNDVGRALEKVSAPRIASCPVHAELLLLYALKDANTLDRERLQPIGISKQCCYVCYTFIKTLRGKPRFIVSGTHGQVCATWAIPPGRKWATQSLMKVYVEVGDLMNKLVDGNWAEAKVSVDDSDMESIDGFSDFQAVHTTSEDDLTDAYLDDRESEMGGSEGDED